MERPLNEKVHDAYTQNMPRLSLVCRMPNNNSLARVFSESPALRPAEEASLPAEASCVRFHLSDHPSFIPIITPFFTPVTTSIITGPTSLCRTYVITHLSLSLSLSPPLSLPLSVVSPFRPSLSHTHILGTPNCDCGRRPFTRGIYAGANATAL